jgi:hypothetical protein
VAVFTNAGQGPLPLAVVADRPTADDAEELTSQLAERGEAVLVADLPRPDSYVGSLGVACSRTTGRTSTEHKA